MAKTTSALCNRLAVINGNNTEIHEETKKRYIIKTHSGR